MPLKSEASGFEIEIGIARLADLKLHEEIIESYLEDLANSIGRDGEIKHPVIVDKDSGTVLDGMHRVRAVERLGHDKIPACSVDYMDSRVRLGSWCRVFKNLQMERVAELCESLNFEVGKCDAGRIDEMLDERQSDLLLVSEDECYSLSQNSGSIKEIFDSAVKIEESLRDESFEPRYEPEKGIVEKLRPGESALLIPPASKEEVINISLSKSVFPHKTTRHVIPARPMGVNVPLPLLEESLSEADRELTDRLKEREADHIPPGSRFDGREYEEELVVFK